MNRRKGLLTSGIVFAFWSFAFFCQSLTFASVLRFGNAGGQVPLVNMFYVKYGVTFFIFVLHFWADFPSEDYSSLDEENPTPELSASFPNKMLFGWLTSLLLKGWKSPLVLEDLYDLGERQKTSYLLVQWRETWTKLAKSYKEINIWRVIWKSFGLQIIWTFALHVLAIGVQNRVPQFLSLLINFVDPKLKNATQYNTSSNDDLEVGEELWKGYLYMTCLVVGNLLIIILNTQYIMQRKNLSLGIRSALTSAIYEKSLKLSNTARKERTVAESMNLCQIDTRKLARFFEVMDMYISAPIGIFLSLLSLWGEIGVACIAGAAVILVVIPINILIARCMKKLRKQNTVLKDKRIKATNEVLDGIKIWKLYAWEQSFQEKIEQFREEEVWTLKKFSYLKAFQTFLFEATPYVVAIASFATYILLGNKLTASIVFVSITYFAQIKEPLNQLPQVVNRHIQSMVSVERINRYLNSGEIAQKLSLKRKREIQ